MAPMLRLGADGYTITRTKGIPDRRLQEQKRAEMVLGSVPPSFPHSRHLVSSNRGCRSGARDGRSDEGGRGIRPVPHQRPTRH
jgi:hypothetical protein